MLNQDKSYWIKMNHDFSDSSDFSDNSDNSDNNA